MKKVVVLIILLFFSKNIFAQKSGYEINKNNNFTDRLYFGGGMSLSNNSQSISVSLSPIIGYMISNKLSTGVGVTYQYLKYNSFKDNQYGGLVFLRMNLPRQLFSYAEYSFINQVDYRDGTRITVDRLPIGLGFSQSINNTRASINMTATYDFLYKKNNQYYNSPWIFSLYFSF